MPTGVDDRVLTDLIAEQTRRCLAAYAVNPNLVEQDAGIEISSIEGGYGRKQLHELAQNGADALIGSYGRIALVLTDTHLYCANEGEPLTARGIEALMASHLSVKRDDQIGRFGLGFKSVLGISDSPEIISKTVAICFDRASAAATIRAVKPSAQRTAVLRTGTTLDPAKAAAEDPTLARLLSWATTVVRLPLKPGTSWLASELVQFPPEFLLFAPHVTRLDLEGGPGGTSATWTSTRVDNRISLDCDGQTTDWQIFEEEYRPSAAARLDAGQISGRDEINVAWAIPVKSRNRPGRFWAYFPTKSSTTLSGIVNAPFKTNEDRHDILDGLYNREILTEVLPQLISRNLSNLVDPADPCSLLEILPARGKEARSWADEVVNEPIMTAVAARPCLPNLDGLLMQPNQLWLMPEFLTERPRWVDRWVSSVGRQSEWVHQSVNKDKERRAKAVRLQRMRDRDTAEVGPWLHGIVDGTGAPGSCTAIVLAGLINQLEPDHVAEMRKAPVVLNAVGVLVAPSRGKIFLPESDADTSGQFVATAVASDPDALNALRELGIGLLDTSGKFRMLVHQIVDGQAAPATVGRLWQLARQLRPEDAAKEMLSGFGIGATPVRMSDGHVAKIWDGLLPGTIVPAEASADSGLTIDISFHAQDRKVLELLGAWAEPRQGKPLESEGWYAEWRAAAREAYLVKARSDGRRPSIESIEIRPGQTAHRLDLLAKLSENARVKFTENILRGSRDPWTLDSSSRATGSAMNFMNPGLWWVHKHGRVATALGPFPMAYALAPGLPQELLPVARLAPELIRALQLPSVPAQRDWKMILKVATERLEVAKLHRLYGIAAIHNAPKPEDVKISQGQGTYLAPPEDCLVTADASDYQALLDGGHQTVLAGSVEQAEALCEHWELTDAKGLIHREVLTASSGESMLLADMYPGLQVVMPNLPSGWQLVPCSELAVQVVAGDVAAAKTTTFSVVREADTIYHLDQFTAAQLLREINTQLHLGLTTDDLDRVHKIAAKTALNSNKVAVRNATTVAEKIVKMVGPDVVRSLVSKAAVDMVESRSGKKLSPTQLVDMATASLGGQLIKKLEPALEERGFAPPKQMSGGTMAREWVRDLRLPEELAGQTDVPPPSREEIMGPITLPILHEYQKQSIQRVLRVLGPVGPNRGLVSLPTGSGKTRVAVESVVRYLEGRVEPVIILWIAQSHELCEQAAETWTYVWRAIGSQKKQMTMSRLWGSNDATVAGSGVHLVIATDYKLASVSKNSDYDWLAKADIVIVDEAHTSITKTYTALFKWLGRGIGYRERPLIGLSATPFRGNNEAQTQQLINRYDKNLLTDGVFGEEDPHEYLQREGILAHVEHQELEGMRLTPVGMRPSKGVDDYEANHLNAFDQDLVAADTSRNERILDSIEALPIETTALVFAASVQHAEMLAAVLCQEGVSAASISAYSASAERRRVIRQFRDGEIRVITNYNVLSQGFDAPKVGAIYVVRPTFSPNRYQQMIGRGLRGPKNGGSETVLIVNVKDNIDAFGEQLAFHHFDWLWKK